MTKLIGSIATIVFATATVAGAAPRQGVVGKAGATAQAKTVKSAKPANRKARKAVSAKNHKAPTAQKAMAKGQRQAVKEEVKIAKHDRYAEEQELKGLKANVKTAQKAGDWQRVSRDRREMYRLEAHVRADKADDQDQTRQARAAVKKRSSRIPFWGWWRRS